MIKDMMIQVLRQQMMSRATAAARVDASTDTLRLSAANLIQQLDQALDFVTCVPMMMNSMKMGAGSVGSNQSNNNITS
jgi:hypothetical protein